MAPFRLAASGRTSFGRGRARLEWEVKPLGQAFDGSGLARSATSLDSGTGGAPLNEVVTGLQLGPNHWRARLLYDAATSPFQQRSRWFTIPWNGWNETDLTVRGSLGGYVWSDIDHDGIREPGEPVLFGSVVSLFKASGLLQGQTFTGQDGHYVFDVWVPDSYRLEFGQTCFGMTTQDQGADDTFDSDPDPITGQTGLIGPSFTMADDGRWSAGLVGVGGFSPPDQPVFITGARPGDPGYAETVLDIADPNAAGSVTSYNIYRSTDPSLPPGAWSLIDEADDVDQVTPGVQVSVYGLPAVGTGYFYQVTAYNSTCIIEGPR